MINNIIPHLNSGIESHFKRINKIEITSKTLEGFRFRIIYDNNKLQAEFMCRDFNQMMYDLTSTIKDIENYE